MSVEIILDRATTPAEPVRLGPVHRVQVGHRRLVADDVRLLRHFDGGWHWGGKSYLEVRIVPVTEHGLVTVGFAHPWAGTTAPETGSSVRLYGDRLLIEPDGRWVATDDDDGRCWIAEGSGLANRELILSAA